MSEEITKDCEVCSKQAFFCCGKCQNSFYCTKEHQLQHWKASHSQTCGKSTATSNAQESLKKQIIEYRKSYYQKYAIQNFAQCLIDAKILIHLQKQLYNADPSTDNRLEYSATLCLLVKSFLNLNQKKMARNEMESYLKNNREFLQNTSEFNENFVHQDNLTNEKKTYFQIKMNLISTIANLCHGCGMQCADYYFIYVRYAIRCFGEDSLEVSNCFFLLGCYFTEEGELRKAIVLFEKAAQLRKSASGDCYYNIGLLYKLLGRNEKALETLEKAMKYREEQYNDNSKEVADVCELTGIIFMETNDFKTAMIEFERAFAIRELNPQTSEYENLIELIQQLYQKLSLFISKGYANRLEKPKIYTHLKEVIESNTKYWEEDRFKQHSDVADSNEGVIGKAQTDQRQRKGSDDNIQSSMLVLSEEFLRNLNPLELFRLSELQLLLQTCQPKFEFAYTFSNSQFLHTLSPENFQKLKNDNPVLFELMQIEDLKEKAKF